LQWSIENVFNFLTNGSARGVSQKPRLARFLFAWQSWAATGKSLFPCGKAKFHTGNRFSRVEKRNSTQEIAFPVWESKIPHRKSLFPCGKSKMPRRKSLFLCGKSKIQYRKSLFLCGKSLFLRVGVPRYRYHHHRRPFMTRAKVSPR